MKKYYVSLAGIMSIAILALILLPGTAAAQGSDPTDDEVNAIAKKLYCPVCENIPLDACGTTACEQWRGIIRDKLKEGWTEEQIRAYFVEQYGDRVLAEPPRKGFYWLVYVVPPLIFAGGIFLLYSGFQRWKGEDTARVVEDISPKGKKIESPGNEYISRVEEELKKRKEL
jgi:cytochrome c-type biogenesis protein CcmH